MPATRSGMTPEAIEEVIAQRVAEALETYKANQNVGNEGDNGNGNGGGNDNGNGNENGGGNGNLNGNNNNGNGNHGDIVGGAMQAARECTYKEFLNCQPRNFKGTKGSVGFKRWFEKMESVFHIIGTDAAYEMTWKELMKLITEMVPGEEEKIERMASGLMDQKVRANAARQADNKRNKCKLHHAVPCTVKCGNYKKVGHMSRDCKTPASATNQRAPLANQKATVTCYECGRQGHYRSDCPKLKNQTRGNQEGNREARGRAYALGGGRKANQEPNVVTADRKIIRADTIIQGCTLNFLNHPFNIDLMRVELGSFDVIIGMDWLTKYHVVIVCDEKIICIPYGDEVLMIQGDKSEGERNSKLNIISCTKTQKYIQKGCHVFLAQITKKKIEDKSEGKRLEDVPIVWDFSEVFPEDLPRLTPASQVEFQIDLVPSVAPVARAPYRLAPSERQELSA
ncbi:putative reverse transcriptase domain-containing protein [Tanacetum coccineum]